MKLKKILCMLLVIASIISTYIISYSSGYLGGIVQYSDGTTRWTTDEEDQMYRSLVDSGVDAGDAGWAMRNQYFGSGGNGDGSLAPAAPTPAPAAQTPASPAAPAPAPSKPEKTYSHDFPEINDEALEALSHFTSDGVPESAYINVLDSSEKNTIPGSTLSLSLKNSEDLKVSYVKEDGTVNYTWGISNLLVEDDYELDLSVKLERDASSEFPGTSTLKFEDGKTISGNHLSLAVNTGVSENVIHVYKKNADNYEEIYTGETDENGMLLLYPEELTEYVLSETDIIAEQERVAAEKKAEEERLAKEKEEEKKKEELRAEGAKDVVPVTEVASREDPSTEAPSEVAPSTPAKNNSFPVIPVAAGAVVLLVAIILIVKKMRG